MSLFQSSNPKEEKHSGILGAFSVDNIKWEPEDDAGASLVVFKYPYEDFPNGSYLQVAPSQMAVFTNNLSAGDSLTDDGSGRSQVSVFTGPCKIKLDTGDSRFAPFRNLTHELSGGSSVFHCFVYFINTTFMNELRWGTVEPILVQDPEEEVNIHVQAFGLYGAHIEQTDSSIAPAQARKFLMKVVGTRGEFSREELTQYMRAKILEYVPDLLGRSIIDRNIGILKISTHLSELSKEMKEKLSPYFDEFGLTLDNFSFHSIKPMEEDLAAINEMKVARKRSEYQASMTDIESAALARKRQREGYTYQQERGMDVMEAAASNKGTGASSMMGAGMGIGMGAGIGGALGMGFSDLARNTMGAAMNPASACPSCGHMNPAGAKFCQECGAKLEQHTTCPKCGHENPAGAKFCQECGAKLEQHTTCPKCGHENPAGAKFCQECGAKLSAAPTHCPNCGSELPAGIKFCPNCGAKIDQ